MRINQYYSESAETNYYCSALIRFKKNNQKGEMQYSFRAGGKWVKEEENISCTIQN